jgi:Ribosomal protein L7/L12 C-terminal domain
MDSYETERIAKLERQVALLYRHLNLDAELNDAAPFSGAPVPAFGAPPQPAFGSAPQPAFGASPQPAFGSAPQPVFDAVPQPAFGSASPPPAAGPSFPPAFAEALRRGRLIEAIKIYRQVTGLGLKDAKEAVEALIRGGGV